MAANLPNAQGTTPTSEFTHKVLLATALVLGLVLLLLLTWYAVYVLLLVFAGLLLTILIRSLSELLGRFLPLSDSWLVTLALATIAAVVSGLIWFAAPSILNQLSQLIERLPQSFVTLRDELLRDRFGQWVLKLTDSMPEFRTNAPAILSRATGVVSTTVSALFSVMIVLFVAVYLAYDPVLYTNGMLRLVPLQYRNQASEIMAATGYTLRWWIIGQLIAMLIVGVATGLGLWALGVPLAFALGVVAAVLEFVPNFGPILAAAPAVLLAFTTAPVLGIYVIILYVLVQQTESLIIQPLIQQKTVDLPPVVNVLAQVLLAIMAGPLGLLLATPITASVMVLVKMLYVEKTLGDSVDTPADHMRPEDHPPLPMPTVHAERTEEFEPEEFEEAEKQPEASVVSTVTVVTISSEERLPEPDKSKEALPQSSAAPLPSSNAAPT